MISFLDNFCESNEKLITRMFNKVTKHKINYKTLIVFFFFVHQIHTFKKYIREKSIPVAKPTRNNNYYYYSF